MSPNYIAYAALFSWPIIALVLFYRYTFGTAFICAVLGAQYLLPARLSVKIPLIPTLDKTTIPVIVVAVIAGIQGKLILRPDFATIFFGAFVFSPFASALLNGDLVVVGARVLPSVGIYDGVSAMISQFIFILPFVIARSSLYMSKDLLKLLRILVFATLLYSVLVIFEIRFSPQLHLKVYGYYPTDFIMAVREGSFRPMVFMEHGLLLSLFVAISVIAATGLWRLRYRVHPLAPAWVPATYLFVVLAMSRSLGATLFGTLFAPLVKLSSPRLQLRVAVLIAALVLSYPLARTAGLIPTASIIELAAVASEDRSRSVAFRFLQEESLLARARERFWFGWGRYGRGRVYDSESGDDISVTDGRWVVTMAQSGFVGFLLEFMLLASPIFLAFRNLKYARSFSEQIVVSTTAIIVAVLIFDQLPNSTVTPWTLLVCGALFGWAERARFLTDSQARTPEKWKQLKSDS